MNGSGGWGARLNSVVLAEIHPNNEQRPGWMKAEDWWERG
jgi:hypothetical protein